MNTLSIIALVLAMSCAVVLGQAKRYSDYPEVTTLSNDWLMLAARGGVTNYSIAFGDLKDQINSGVTVTNVSAGVSNQWRIDATNAAGGLVGGPFSASTNTIYPTTFGNSVLRMPRGFLAGSNANNWTGLKDGFVGVTYSELGDRPAGSATVPSSLNLISWHTNGNDLINASVYAYTNIAALDFNFSEGSTIMQKATLQLGGTDTSVAQGAGASSYRNARFSMKSRVGGTGGTLYTVTDLHPTGTNLSAAPYRFDTTINRTNGNLLELANLQSNKFAVRYDGAVVFPDSTVQATAATVLNPLTADVTNVDGVILVGSSSGSGSILSPSDYIYGGGDLTLQSAALTDSYDVFADGVLSLNSGQLTRCFNIFANGASAMQEVTIEDSHDFYAFGNDAMDSFHGTTNHDIYALGSGLRSATIDNSSDIYAIGNDAGNLLSGDGLTHIFLAGSGSEATSSGDWVAGDAAYRYKFPGTEGAVFAGTVTGSGYASAGPGFKSYSTNNVVLTCPDGGSWVLRIANDGTLSTVTNAAGL